MSDCFAVETLTQGGEEEEEEDREIQETRLPSLRCRSLPRWSSQLFVVVAVVVDADDVVEISAEVEEAEEEEAIEVPPLAELGTLHLLPSSSCSQRPVVDFCLRRLEFASFLNELDYRHKRRRFYR